jgi:hypothetical protein
MPVLEEEHAAGRTITRTLAERVDVRRSRRGGGLDAGYR